LEAALRLEAIQNAQWKVWDQKECLHPQAGAECDRVVSAHTVQRARVLGSLVDDKNHVLTFKRARLDLSGCAPEPRKVGWQVASTISGFCARHDAATFADLEARPFDGGLGQCFLIGYRGLCYEVYQKQGVLRAAPALQHLVDRGRSPAEQRRIQRAESISTAGARHGLEQMKALKSVMDSQLLAGAYTGWSRLVLRFRGDLCVAATGAVAPNRDLDGRILQVLHDPSTKMATLMCGVTADDGGGAIVLFWSASDEPQKRFVESVLSRGQDAVPGLLVQFLFAHLENTYFSARWWNALGADDRRHLGRLAMIMNPYYEPFTYEQRRLVPWEIVDLTVERAD
jgi:hypothetical protein